MVYFVILYLLMILCAFVSLFVWALNLTIQESYKLWIICSAIGGVGGATYCIRGVYINVCVKKQWCESWIIWYFLRPIVSAIFGAVSFIVCKTGLLVLDSKIGEDIKFWLFCLVAFIAGYNVDNFARKIEDISEFFLGIKKSRSTNED